MVQRISAVQILRGSNMDPYILNKRPNDPYDGGRITASNGCFVQSLDGFLRDFLPDDTLTKEALDEDETKILTPAVYREKVKHRCIAVIEYGVYLYVKNLNDRVEKLYLPAIQAGSIPNDSLYRRYSEELRFEDEERFERFFCEAIRKALTFTHRTIENEFLFITAENIKPETLDNFLSNLSEKDKDTLKTGLLRNLANAQLRIIDLYVPAIKQGSIPDTPEYNKRITELGIKDRDELEEKLFYFLRYALCLTNWNDDPVLRTDARAFRSCLD